MHLHVILLTFWVKVQIQASCSTKCTNYKVPVSDAGSYNLIEIQTVQMMTIYNQ